MSTSNVERVSTLISKLEKWIAKRRAKRLECGELMQAVQELDVLRAFYLVREIEERDARHDDLEGGPIGRFETHYDREEREIRRLDQRG